MTKLLRWIGYAAALGLLGAYAFFALAGPNPIHTIPDTQRKIETMRESNRQLRDEIQRQKKYLDAVEQNPQLRDREIRKRFNKQKPGEKTIILPD